MKNLRSKMKKQGGFTLIEMLIVVAIIAILVAVSIPVVNTALNRARIATDAANERAAKAAVMVAYLGGEKVGSLEFKANTVYAYDAVKGELVEPGTTVSGYGKCTDHNGKVIVVRYMAEKNEVQIAWMVSSDLRYPDNPDQSGCKPHNAVVDTPTP